MNEYLRAIILGVVQGIAEFLPISSSGHLVIFSQVMKSLTGTAEQGAEDLLMNVALHLGTLFSILVVYRQDLLQIYKNPKLIGNIIIATLPIVAVGLLLKLQFEQVIESIFETPLAAGCCLLITAILLVWGQSRHKENKHLPDLSVWGSLLIGCFQAVAILPGISRSGSTIAGGMLDGLQRNDAAKFSFLIAIPAISGATLLVIKDLSTTSVPTESLLALAVGMIVSFVVGMFALRLLLTIVTQKKLHFFAIYCALMGIATIVWQLVY